MVTLNIISCGNALAVCVATLKYRAIAISVSPPNTAWGRVI
tara:strand:- start:41 stop:163 length:123 start_codon:yes stop_codon:yes gene_type:complete